MLLLLLVDFFTALGLCVLVCVCTGVPRLSIWEKSSPPKRAISAMQAAGVPRRSNVMACVTVHAAVEGTTS